MFRSKIVFLLIFVFSAVNLFAQNNQPPSPLSPTVWGVVYDVPATKDVKLKANVPYLKDAKGTLAIDVYTPPNMKAGEKLPAVVFLNAIGDSPQGKVKDWEIYKSFPRLIAAHGMIGISMEADGTRIQESLRGLFDFLEKEGDKHGIDGARLGVYAASANTTQSLVYLMSETASKNIKAAALFYGATPAPTAKIRKDLPVLFILAEGDAAGFFGQQANNLWQRVMEARAPWTLLYASNLPHAFDAFSDNDESRRVIQQAIAFWKSNLEAVPQPVWNRSEARSIVEAIYWNDPQKSAELLSKYIEKNPTDAQAFIQYGRMLQQLQRADEAVANFEKAMKLEPNNPFIYGGIGQIRFAQKRYDEAAANLSKAIEGGWRNSFLYGQLAYAQLALNRNEEAIKTYEKAFEMGIPPGANTRGLAYYNMASGYVRLKQTDKAFEMLSKSVDEGFNNRQTFETDTDLAPIRTDARFQELLKRLPPTSPTQQRSSQE
jgi:tetratricopeptide (TPR) repeat protein